MNGRPERNQPTTLEAALRASQILVGALIGGLIIFTGVVIALVLNGTAPSQPAPPGMETIYLAVMGAMTCATLVASLFMRGLRIGMLRRKAESSEGVGSQEMRAQFQVLIVLRAALAEGPALFASVILLLTGAWIALAGTAVGLLALAWVFPTRAKFDGFVRDVTGRMPGV